jgi:hypothetical protein
MNRVSIFLVVIFIAVSVFAGDAVTLGELLKADAINVDDKNIVINGGVHVYIYSLKDFKLIKKFGKAGAGPQEFMTIPAAWFPNLFIYLQPDRIFINSLSKISLFSRDGEFIKESKKKMSSPFNIFIPLGKKYVGLDSTQEENTRYISYSLYDLDMNKEKEFFRTKFPSQPGQKDNPLLMGMLKNLVYRRASKDKVFIPTLEGIIHVFDNTGKEICVINPQYPKVKFTGEHKTKYDEFFKTSARFKQIYARQQHTIEFPAYFPLLKDYRVDSHNVYIITNKKTGVKHETFIYNHNGKLLAKVQLPLVPQDILEVYPFDIQGGKIYQLVENEDEDWELRTAKIK